MSVPQLVTEFAADGASLHRKYPGEFSLARERAELAHLNRWQAKVKAMSGEELGVEDWNDLVLLENTIAKEINRAERVNQRNKTGRAVIPGCEIGIQLLDAFTEFNFTPPPMAAKALSEWKQILDRSPGPDAVATPKPAMSSALKILDSLKKGLEAWHRFFASYDPEFDWWVAEPYEAITKTLDRLSNELKKDGLGIQEGDDDAIIGDPIGLDGLTKELQFELIGYTPQELIEIAEVERKWCQSELAKAAKELGLPTGFDAIQHVKTLHQPPGKQPELVRDLAVEAIEFVEQNDLFTIPELAKQTWRMAMMAADRQKVSPFFLGGEQIIVSFPTSQMDHNFKYMSLRGNNRHFARATVHHELIPGHHIQQFFNARHKTHRRAFWTPFWVEGWTLHWEMVLWDHHFARGPEDRVGMLFWRLHRALRVIFSLKFHLGEMSPSECIEMLVNEGGHERSNAEGEVRRSFSGAYPELYQAAYLIGGIQVRALAKELSAQGIPLKVFLDRMIVENEMPIEALRALILNEKLTRPATAQWKFS